MSGSFAFSAYPLSCAHVVYYTLPLDPEGSAHLNTGFTNNTYLRISHINLTLRI